MRVQTNRDLKYTSSGYDAASEVIGPWLLRPHDILVVKGWNVRKNARHSCPRRSGHCFASQPHNTQRHIPADRNRQLHHLENIWTRTSGTVTRLGPTAKQNASWEKKHTADGSLCMLHSPGVWQKLLWWNKLALAVWPKEHKQNLRAVGTNWVRMNSFHVQWQEEISVK
jgi:hypothetical protein